MKVFLSWSGNTSHKVAIILRDWFPSVIQSIEPYVSSEDIDKGARWSTDIATELENSSFGILCVTKENINAPWLNFEAGALSKTIDKSFVCPFLFDIKRSEVNGPVLQFQSTIFAKEDIKKLLHTMNKACGEGCLEEVRLDKTFDVWYPTLEEELDKALQAVIIEPSKQEEEIEVEESIASEILEEILDISRNNQKLLRKPDQNIVEYLEKINQQILEANSKIDLCCNDEKGMYSRKFHPFMIEELFMISEKYGENNYYGLLMILSLYQKDIPWLYDIGKDVVNKLSHTKSEETKNKIIMEFVKMVDFSLSHPMFREFFSTKKDFKYFRELPFILEKLLRRQ